MLYVPKDISKEVNISETHFFRSFVLPVGLFFGVLFVLVYFVVPNLIQRVSPETEIRWIQEYQLFGIRSDDLAAEVPVGLTELVNQLWHPYTSAPDLNLKVNILKTAEENAYMGFGGQIAFTKGLIQKAKSENELAMIICHELGHLYHRHIVNRLTQMIIWSIIDFFLSAANYSINSSIGFLTDQKFNRDQEKQADSFGLDCLHKKYGHVNGGKVFFQRLSTKRKDNIISQMPEFIMTHPHSENRVIYLEEYALEKGYSWDGPLSLNSFKTDQSKNEGAK